MRALLLLGFAGGRTLSLRSFGFAFASRGTVRGRDVRANGTVVLEEVADGEARAPRRRAAAA